MRWLANRIQWRVTRVKQQDVSQPQPAEAWWAAGDFPARSGCKVEPLIDGRAALYAMCVAFLTAREYILLAGWDICVDLPLVRGGDVRLGPDGSPEQERLLSLLREQGLSDEALALWSAEQLRVVDVLGYAARRGVRVGVLLWDAFRMSHVTNDPVEQREALRAVGVDCVLDDSSRRITHVTQALHQKCAVVDGRVAFVGGIDLTVEESGDYDRWDTHQHPCASIERAATNSPSAHPWHDVHTRVTGPVVADVLTNIVQRWAEVAQRHDEPMWPADLALTPPAPVAGGVQVQVVRTIPPATYDFAPRGIATIKDAYIRALGMARRYVYLENQYLWPEVFLGLDNLRWGERSDESMEVLHAMAGALARGAHVALALPDHPNCGRRFTDGGVEWLRAQAASAGAADRLHVFTLGNAGEDETAPGGIVYRPVYTHAKVALVDDVWWTAGSANLNSRGVHSDAEMNVIVYDPASARDLRLRLWAEHLRREGVDHADLADPLAGVLLLEQSARANSARVQARQPLVGHVLPYLTEDDGKRMALPVHEEHGWLDNIEGGAGAIAERHAGKYL